MTELTGGSQVVRRYYLYRATATVGFVTPIFTIFLLRELSYSQLGALSGVYSALVVLGEIPTGYVGDRLGHRNSLVIGAGCKAVSLIGFVVAETFPAFVVLYVFWAAGLTFDSGSRSAWLYETLAERLDESAFTRVRGRGGSINRWVGAGTMVVGSLLYVVDPLFPFVAATGLTLLGMPILFSLPEPGSAEQRRIETGEIVGVVWSTLSGASLRSFVAYTALALGSVSAAQLYVQPIAVDVLSGIQTVETIPPSATLGILYAAFTAVAAVASYYADVVEDRLGRRRTLLFLPVGTAALMIVPLALPLLAFPAFFAMRGVGPLVRPVTHAHLNEHVGSAGRATVISASSMMFGLVRTPLSLAGGVLADATSALAAVSAFGAVFLIGGLLLWGIDGAIVRDAQ
ncbi:MAG: MFS family permease [Halobacteriales archaeon]